MSGSTGGPPPLPNRGESGSPPPLPGGLANGPAADGPSNHNPKQTRPERNRQGGSLWIVVTLVVIVIGFFGAGAMTRALSNKASDGSTFSRTAEAVLSAALIAACWNNKSNALNKFERNPRDPGAYSSGSVTPFCSIYKKDGAVVVSIIGPSPRGAEANRFLRQAAIAVQCSSDLSSDDAEEVVDRLLSNAQRSAVGVGTVELPSEKRTFKLLIQDLTMLRIEEI